MAGTTIIRFGNPVNGATDGVEAGNLAIAINVTAQAKALAPVDTGQLRNSIMYKTPVKSGGHNDSGGEQSKAVISVNPRIGEAYVGANLDHAIYQEFGTRNIPPQPYLRPAIDQVAKGMPAASVLIKIEQEQMRGALKRGQKREQF